MIDPVNLEIFLTWYQLNGPEHGISITEAATMPAALRQDLLYLLRELGKLRRRRDKQRETPQRSRSKK